MYTFTYPQEKYDEVNISKKAILTLINKHVSIAQKLATSYQYYEGQHSILQDPLGSRKSKLVCNHAKEISDTASSYFVGEPISYKSDDDITALTDALEYAGADEVDGDNGLDLSICGLTYDYTYAKQGESNLVIKNLSPLNTFMVYDDTIEQNELFAVYYYGKKDDTGNTITKYIATVLTQNYKYVLDIAPNAQEQITTEIPEPHYMGMVPITEYRNNKLGIGDFEMQIPLIDAYNVIMSDRVDDKEQFIDSILAIYGALLSDEDTEQTLDGANGDGKGSEVAMEKLKKEKLLELPGDGVKAEYLTHTFDESGVEILRKAIEQDIHKFSHIPCMTDDSFAGNVSGVAMEFKLLGMENITKIKTRYYKKGLRKRMQLFSNWMLIKGISVDVVGITPVFTRCMPKNILEISQWVSNLWGKVSKKTLLSQIPFVSNVEDELAAVEKENKDAVKLQQQLFNGTSNTPPEDDYNDDSDNYPEDDVNGEA